MKLSLQRVTDIEIATATGKLNRLARVVARWEHSSDWRGFPPVTRGACMMVREMSGTLLDPIFFI